MEPKVTTEQQQQWAVALQKLKSAIEILDRWNAPTHIAAHVDLAVHQLQDTLDERAANAGPDQILTNAVPH